MPKKQSPKKTKTDSTCIDSYSYNKSNQQLTINFQQRGTYTYNGVGSDIADGLAAAGSKGSYFNSVIRPNYPGVRGGGSDSSSSAAPARGIGASLPDELLSSDEDEGL